MRAPLLFVAVLLFCGCAAAPQRSTRKDWALWSWKPRGQRWHYAFTFPDEDVATDDYKIMHSRDVVVGESALKRRLAQFASPTEICWRDDPPKYILKFPPYDYRHKIKDWARARGVYIIILPSIYDQDYR